MAKFTGASSCMVLAATLACAGAWAAEPPCGDAMSHQFDFWIGDWEVALQESGKIVGFNRITWFDNHDGSVRQLWEISRNAAKTWEVVFDGIYKKKE